jgi:hypothetical protein
MFTQDDLMDLKAATGDWYPSTKFLIMFIGVVAGPLVLLAVGGRDANIESERVKLLMLSPKGKECILAIHLPGPDHLERPCGQQL